MTQRQNIAAVIPLDLLDEDDLLHRFGRWAMTRDARRRCGSAERYYRPLKDTTNTNEDDRAPRELLMGTEAAMAVQRALAQVPAKWREVIEVHRAKDHSTRGDPAQAANPAEAQSGAPHRRIEDVPEPLPQRACKVKSK
jgi:hypothetical protein